MIKAFLTLLTGSFLSKIIGLFRELIFAFYYGTNFVASSFRLSQIAIFIPIQFLTADILNAGFLPLYTKYLKQDRQKAAIFYWLVKFLLFILSFLLLFGLFFYSSGVVKILAPGFNEESLLTASKFVEILSISIPFFLLSGLFNYLEIANGSYLLVSIRTVIQSLGIILGVILSYYFNNILLLAWGFNIAYIVFFIVSLKRVIKQKRILYPSFNKRKIKLVFNRFVKIIKPLFFLPFLLQANIAIERIVASLISSQSVAAIDYARFITETLIVLLALPIGLISLSSFSTLNQKELIEKLKKIISIVTIISLPLTFYFTLNSELIVEVLFKRGEFNQTSLEVTSAILFGLSIGIFFQIIQYILIKTLNARFENRKVLLFMAIGLSFNILFNILFYKLLGAATIGYAYSLYGFILFILTLREFKIVSFIAKKVLPLAIFGIGYIIISNFISFENILIKFVVSLIVFIIYWGCVIFLTPNLKKEIESIKGLR